MKTNYNAYRWNHEEEEQVMMVAADSLVHFADGASSMSRRADQDSQHWRLPEPLICAWPADKVSKTRESCESMVLFLCPWFGKNKRPAGSCRTGRSEERRINAWKISADR